MSEKKTPKAAAPKTRLQKYLTKKIPAFQRGSGDCGAFVAGWANTLTGKESIAVKPQTFGDIARKLRERDLVGQADDNLLPLGFTSDETRDPKDGDIVVFTHAESLGGRGIGIFSKGSAVSRMEGESLHVQQNPEIVKAWRLSQS